MQGNQGWLPLWAAIEGVPEHQMTTEFCFYPEPSYFIILGAPHSFPPTPSRHTHTHQVAGGNLWNILSFFAEETGGTKLVGGNMASQSHTRDSNSGSKFPAQCPLHPSPPRRGVLPLGVRDSDPPLQTLVIQGLTSPRRTKVEFSFGPVQPLPWKVHLRSFPHLPVHCWPWALAKLQNTINLNFLIYKMETSNGVHVRGLLQRD